MYLAYMLNTYVYTGVFALSVFNVCFCFMHTVFWGRCSRTNSHINVQKTCYPSTQGTCFLRKRTMFSSEDRFLTLLSCLTYFLVCFLTLLFWTIPDLFLIPQQVLWEPLFPVGEEWSHVFLLQPQEYMSIFPPAYPPLTPVPNEARFSCCVETSLLPEHRKTIKSLLLASFKICPFCKISSGFSVHLN